VAVSGTPFICPPQQHDVTWLFSRSSGCRSGVARPQRVRPADQEAPAFRRDFKTAPCLTRGGERPVIKWELLISCCLRAAASACLLLQPMGRSVGTHRSQVSIIKYSIRFTLLHPSISTPIHTEYMRATEKMGPAWVSRRGRSSKREYKCLSNAPGLIAYSLSSPPDRSAVPVEA